MNILKHLLCLFTVAALNSQYFEEDFSSDEDYEPASQPVDDWKKVSMTTIAFTINYL